MEILGYLLVGFMILIGIVFFFILPFVSYLIFRHLSKRGKAQKNIGLAIFILTTLGMVILGMKIIFGPSGFGPEYETIEIEQKIGGKLLCNSTYTADQFTWRYNITYKYIDLEGDSIDFKSGLYLGREWKKDEQILKFDKFLILKTGARIRSDRLIIKNSITDSTKIFDIDKEFIEKDSFWRAQNIKTLLDICCAETYIESIKGNEILLRYKFRTNESFTKKYGERMITYSIDKETGEIEMTKIK